MGRNELEAWLASLELPFPLTSEHHEAHAASIARWCREIPGIAGGSLEALLWIRIGHLESAHGIVQHATRGIAAYLHGVVHRMEGDGWNSKYWFRQVQSPKLLGCIEAAIAAGQAACADRFAFESPAAFVDACLGATNVSRESLRRCAQLEWEALWQVASDRDGFEKSDRQA